MEQQYALLYWNKEMNTALQGQKSKNILEH